MFLAKCVRVFAPRSLRFYRVLAIESSCDDSSVALLDCDDDDHSGGGFGQCRVLCHLKDTLDSASAGGIIPTQAHTHHQSALPCLLEKLELSRITNRPDLIAVTRGPGMLGSLSVGLNLAKGLSLALGVPLLGVNHMLGHLLVPRMTDPRIEFPFTSLLVSGGHTMLVHSEDIINHRIVCDTIDVAVGDSLDKCGRELGITGIMIGKEMERWARNAAQGERHPFRLPNPLSGFNKGKLAFSFAPFVTAVKEQLKLTPLNGTDTQKGVFAGQIQEAIFTHLISKIRDVMRNPSGNIRTQGARSFVCSGGVSSNVELRRRLELELKDHFDNFYYPEAALCTDNAVMIGWTGIELMRHFKTTKNVQIYNDMSMLPVRKWALDELAAISEWKKEKYYVNNNDYMR
ncbi:putative N(6)-L-threonylcarbamoyladenine synthase KNAG_0A05620 [Huiozyma naganishii CBS 8797]|uniref:N(6)-L-threonylcarbamoyladenine synthase n=1 Tax=Huiozyma naganishii (strain ATCC MYA-139 / BCRC 22969 / CBS 8797 / KCTC 17520 / NBRC 10181 / NCYC 3082 / Yp74L-3) TaxID=1071383 RepID=J7S3W4_HUIN7|nr:hypothetical protein KNAG_0A05620 [Kazachstania naganishii CBS 8797]CCK68226.1 hypothetical protein KNAG_0A05620 [Kazachstania naganishii CBS 8797]